ncbi:MAG: extracellular solute-binding protein [Marmoricola sp.]
MTSRIRHPGPLPSHDRLGAVEISRRGLLRGTAAAGALGSLGMLAACGSGGGGGPKIAAKATSFPSYYPGSYDDVVAAAKKESGHLTVYSNMDVVNWKPIIDGFQKLYPFVQSVSTNNLDSSEVFERYYSESSAHESPASFLVSGDPGNWVRFAKGHHAMSYRSPETGKLPGFANPMPGLYTFSADPILMAWNKSLLSGNQVPTGIGSLVKLVQKHPETYKNKITTYDVPATSFGFAIDYTYTRQRSDGWKNLQALLPSTRPESSSGPMVEKLQSGEYVAGYFLSSTVVLPAVDQSSAVLGWSYIDDGTLMFLRGMAIPKTAPEPATAKLMLDYILSGPGQEQVYNGGFTPYRPDVTNVPRTYQKVVKKLGKDNVMIIGYEDVPKAKLDAFNKRWSSYLH